MIVIFRFRLQNAIKFTPTGGLVRVSLDLSRFEVNPLASIASDQLLLAQGINPKKREVSKSARSRQHASWHQPPSAGTLDGFEGMQQRQGANDSTADGGSPTSGDGSGPLADGQRPKAPKLRPIVPELLGTVMVRVNVKDSGAGIPLDHQQLIFQAYGGYDGKIQKGNGTGSVCDTKREVTVAV